MMHEQLRTKSEAYIVTNHLNLEETKEMVEAIQGNPSLKVVHFEGPLALGNGLPRVKVFFEGLKGSSVTHLGVPNSCLQDEEVKALAAVLKHTNLTSLQLGNNDIGVKGLKALASGLKSSKVISLELPACGLDLKEVKVLAENLKKQPLVHLCLQHNRIGDDSAKVLGAVLKGSALENLNLDENDVGDAGAKYLAQGLKGSKVRILGLGENPLGDEGVKALAGILTESSVEQLFLYGTQMRDEGVKALAAVMKRSSVNLLDVRYETLARETSEVLLEGLRDSPVTVLFVEFGEFTCAKLRKQFNEVLKANRERSFVLQMEAQKDENTLCFKFRTLAGTVAAQVDWSLDRPVQEMPEAVLEAMRSSGFQFPFRGFTATNLRIVRPDGALLNTGLKAPLLTKQLGIAVPAAKKRAREPSSSKAPMKRSRAK